MSRPASGPVKSAMRPLAAGSIVDDGVHSIPRPVPAAPPLDPITTAPAPPPRPPLPPPPPASAAADAGCTQICDRQTSPPLHAASVEQELPTTPGGRERSLLQLWANAIPTINATAPPRDDLADTMTRMLLARPRPRRIAAVSGPPRPVSATPDVRADDYRRSSDVRTQNDCRGSPAAGYAIAF